jgi:hypothetical protein
LPLYGKSSRVSLPSSVSIWLTDLWEGLKNEQPDEHSGVRSGSKFALFSPYSCLGRSEHRSWNNWPLGDSESTIVRPCLYRKVSSHENDRPAGIANTSSLILEEFSYLYFVVYLQTAKKRLGRWVEAQAHNSFFKRIRSLRFHVP